MTSKRESFKKIYQAQVNFDDNDFSQIERVIFYKQDKEDVIRFAKNALNIKSLHLRNFIQDEFLDIQQFTNLERLFWDSGNLTTLPIQTFSNLSKLKNLYELNLRLRNGFTVNDLFFDTLGSQLSQIQSLTKLILKIELESESFDDQNYNDMIKFISILKNLQHLRIVNRNRNMEQSFLKKSWQTITSFVQLVTLDLDLQFENSSDESEVNFLEIIKGKPICNTLRNLRLLLVDSNQQRTKISLLQALSEFKSLEIIILQLDFEDSIDLVDQNINQILKNNRYTLRKLELFLFYNLLGSDENIDDAYNIKFSFLDAIGDLKKLEQFYLLSNLFTNSNGLLTISRNLQNCIQLYSVVIVFSYEIFSEKQKKIREFFDNISLLPYLTYAEICDESLMSERIVQKYQTKIEVFDIESSTFTYIDPYTVSKIFNKYKNQQTNQNQLNIQQTFKLFIDSIQNQTLEQEDIIQQQQLQQQQNDSQENVELDQEIDENYSENASTLWESQDEVEYSSDGSFEDEMIHKYNSRFSQLIIQKRIEIMKIYVYQISILQQLKNEIGDVQFVNNSYWDLYV